MTHSTLCRLALAAAIAGASAPASGRAATPSDETLLNQCVAAQADKLNFSGAVSIVTPAASTSYVRGVRADPGSAPINAQSRFNLGSVGKMFTAIAVAQLVDAGKIGLDDPVGRYVPGLTAEAAAVTARQLLTHSSGLGDFFTPDNLPAIQRAGTVADLMPLVSSDKPAFQPGTRFQYSNSGFLILGRLVERASGESYDRYLQRHVFGPAGMTATGLEPGPAETLAVGMTAMPVGGPGSAAGGPQMHRAGPGPVLMSGPPDGPLHPSPEAALHGNPAGGGYSTVQDLKRFFNALDEGRLVSAASFASATSAQIVALPAQSGRPELDYGLGFGVGVTDGHRWFGHNGGAPGVTVEATSYPDDHMSMVVMANRDPPSASLLFRRLRAALLAPDGLKTCAAG